MPVIAHRCALGLAAIVTSVACGPARRGSVRVVAPSPATSGSSRAPGLPTAGSLAGRIWNVAQESYIVPSVLMQALAAGHFVLLGEVHDSDAAHARQFEVVSALVAAGRHPAVVFEMIDADRQSAIDRARATSPRDPDAIAAAVDFAHTGWNWLFYRPIVRVALESGAPIVAGNLPRSDARALVMRGVSGLDPATASRMALTEAIEPTVQAEMRAEMRQSHCGMLPEEMLDGMVLAQRARDETMAERLLASGSDGGVLIAGAEHARTDRAVRAALRRRDARAIVLSVGFFEVDPDLQRPAEYAQRFQSTRLPFDYVWFVPAVARSEDVCAPLRRHTK